MPWSTTSSALPHGVLHFPHTFDAAQATVKEKTCDDRECPLGCWIVKAYKRAENNIKALAQPLYMQPDMWYPGIVVGEHTKGTWTSARKQHRRNGAAGLRIPTATHYVVVAIAEKSAHGGKKVLSPGVMSQLRRIGKKKSKVTGTKAQVRRDFFHHLSEMGGWEPFEAKDELGADLPLLGWQDMRFWRRRLDTLARRAERVDQQGFSLPDREYVKLMRKVFDSPTLLGYMFRHLVNRPPKENVSPLGGFWTDPVKRYCQGEDSGLHPTEWIISERWWQDGRRVWVVRADRPTWNQNLRKNENESDEKMCAYCDAPTVAYFGRGEPVGDWARVKTLASRAGARHDDFHRDGRGFTVSVGDRPYHEFISSLQTDTRNNPPPVTKMVDDLADTLGDDRMDELMSEWRARRA